jgi:UTP--glucose-1-phosphate uridylyltransferase
MKPIKKCVIPAAWFGTRFLPATKALPKEMFPIIDKPVMQYLVEEAIAAWCSDIIIVTWRSKRAIEDHFDSNPELETRLDMSWKFDYLKKVKWVAQGANIVYVRQPYPKGDGDAILRTKNLIGDEPFLVLFGDDIIDNPITAAEQLVKKFSEVQAPVIATIPVSDAEVSSYGIIEGEVNGDTLKVSKFLEKPKASETTSRFAAIGKYVLTPDIFEYLEKAESSVWDGEIRLADAFIEKNKTSDIYALQVQGARYDTGSKAWYLKACIAYAMKDEALGKEMKEFMKNYL